MCIPEFGKMTVQNQSNCDNILCQFCCEQEALKRHYYKTHKYCLACKKSFEDNNELICHLLIRHGKRVQCPYCPFFNFTEERLETHMKLCLKIPKIEYGVPITEEKIGHDIENESRKNYDFTLEVYNSILTSSFSYTAFLQELIAR